MYIFTALISGFQLSFLLFSVFPKTYVNNMYFIILQYNTYFVGNTDFFFCVWVSARSCEHIENSKTSAQQVYT